MNIYRLERVIYGINNAKVKELTLFDLDTGLAITEEQRVENNLEGPLTMYVGVAQVIQTLITPVGPGQYPFEFPFLIDASSLQEAFEKYPAMVEEIYKDLREQEAKMIEALKARREQEKSAKDKLVVANQSDLRAIENSGLKLVT